MRGVSPSRSDPAPFEVVFVCTGNQARSPLAAALLRAKVAALPITVRSFGTAQLSPTPALRNAVSVGRALGVELRAHRSRPLAAGCLGEAGLVIGFEAFHVAAAVVEAGALRERSFLARELMSLLDESGDVTSHSPVDAAARVAALHRLRIGRPMLSSLATPDPAGAPFRAFEALGSEIDELTSCLAHDLLGASSGAVPQPSV